MEIIDFSNKNTILNKFVAELRDVDIQQDSMRFRRNLERFGEIMSYKISKRLSYEAEEIQTPLGLVNVNIPEKDIVVAAILNGGTSLADGLRNMFDNCGNAFVPVKREYIDGEGSNVSVESVSSPSLDGKVLIIADAMFATGQTVLSVYEKLLQFGTPKAIHLVCAIASKPGIDFIMRSFPVSNTTIWCGAIDPEINNHGFIVPGMGDASDHCFGANM